MLLIECKSCAVIAPAAFCTRDFPSTSFQLNLTIVGGVEFVVFLVLTDVATIARGGSGFGMICWHGSKEERKRSAA